MAKRLLPLLLLLPILMGSCLQVKRNYLSKEEIGWLRENGENLEVLFGYEAPPDAFTNTLGYYDGLLVDYYRELENALGLSIPMRIFPAWSDIIDYAHRGSDFIIVGIVRTEERDRYLRFTDAFYRHRFDIITSPDSTIDSLADLRLKKFAVVDGYVIGELLRRDYPELKPIRVENDLVELRALSEGEIDAFVTYELYGKYMAESQGITQLRMVPLGQYNVEYSIAVSRDDPMLQSILNKTLARISNRKKRELDMKWYTLKTTKISTRLKILLYSVPPVLLLFTGLVFIWLFSLRREVERQTRVIREREKEFRLLARNRNALILSIPDAMAVTDGEGLIGETNGILSFQLNLSQEDMLGKRVVEILPFRFPADYMSLKSQSELLRTGKIPVLSFNTSVSISPGEERVLSISAAPVTDGDGIRRGEIWILKDITDQSRIENEVLRSRKGKTLAVLAGGISHDLNNLLTCLYGYIDLALMSTGNEEEVKEHLEMALGSLDNARKLTGQMLSFSRGGEAKKEIIYPSEFLADMAEFSLRGRDISLIRDIPEDLPPLMADRGQISQVISNLVINAAQAMEGTGEIHLSAAPEEREDGLYLRISLRDRGPGIPLERQEEIFKPYFTTKKDGNGLGLASCRIIISRHNGLISLNSSPGEGAEFIIHLPVHDAKKGETPSRISDTGPAVTPDRANALIMVPDEYIRPIITRFLSEMGFTIEEAVTLDETRNIFARTMEGGTPFRLVIADLSREDEPCRDSLAGELKRMNENILVIGICNSPEQKDPLTRPECAYDGVLAKPFSYGEFSSLIGRILQKG